MGRSIKPSWPSPALVVASVALIAALAGTAIAGPHATTSAVSKQSVKKIARKQVKKLAPRLARKQIKKLAPGLSVAHADSAATAQSANTATTAANAQRVNGLSVVKIDSRQPEGAPAATILDLAGLQLRARCPDTGGIQVLATTTKENSSLYGYSEYPPNLDRDSFDFEGGEFDTGTTVDLDVEFDGLGDPRVGGLVYEAPDGSVVTVQFAADINGTSKCVFTGTAVGG